MEINLSKTIKQIILVTLLIILPLITLLIGTILKIENAWYYLLSILWFGMGIIFYSAID